MKNEILHCPNCGSEVVLSSSVVNNKCESCSKKLDPTKGAFDKWIYLGSFVGSISGLMLAKGYFMSAIILFFMYLVVYFSFRKKPKL